MALANHFDPLTESRRVIDQADELAHSLEVLAFEADAGKPFSARALEDAFDRLVSLRSRCEYLGREVSLLLIAAPLTNDAKSIGSNPLCEGTLTTIDASKSSTPPQAFGELLDYCMAVESASFGLIGGAR